jgi:hypothetical protein
LLEEGGVRPCLWLFLEWRLYQLRPLARHGQDFGSAIGYAAPTSALFRRTDHPEEIQATSLRAAHFNNSFVLALGK